MRVYVFACLFVLQGVAGSGLLQAQRVAETACDGFVANMVTDVNVPFDITAEGKEFRVKWGMDTAWNSDVNVKRGAAFIGKQQIELARASFNPNYEMTAAGELSTQQKNAFNSRLNNIGNNIGKHVEILLNDDPVDNVIQDMYQQDPHAWAKMFDKYVEHAKNKGFNVVSIAPFNEPDYGWGQDYGKGAKVNFLNICKAVRSGDYPRLDTIRLCGGNTLNDDKALEWYNYLSDYLDEGNTHQLAGNFDNYAGFFTQVAQDGKLGTADEMHNVMEAMVGVEYGMKQGIWWGYDGLARGEFCRASFGRRLAYAEDRTKWTAASVYRNTLDGRYEAFVGTSERQAQKCSFRFVSTDRDVYYDGYGPTREFVVRTPGGTGYQSGQTNAERVVMITYGEDVQPAPINGEYLIMNKATKMVLAPQGGGTGNGTAIMQMKKSKQDYLSWYITPTDSAHGGDFSYYTFKHAKSGKQADVWNWNISTGAEINLYDGSEGDNEQYWLEYAGDGFYYIHNKYSNLVLGVSGTTANTRVTTQNKGTTTTAINRQLWRLLPTDANCELTAPSAPTNLQAYPRSKSIRLTWEMNQEEDMEGYTVLRAESRELSADSVEWSTIARCVKGTEFLDNKVEEGVTYTYKIKAVDHSVNTSEASNEVSAKVTGEKGLVCRLEFDQSLNDTTENQLDARYPGTPSYTKVSINRKSGIGALNLDGNKFVQLPTSVGDMKEMTICCWLKGSSSGSWARVFDFGSDTDHYMFLTTNSGSDMRFVMKNGGDEQILSAKKLSSSTWKHLCISIGSDAVVMYVDGEEVARTTDITIRPSDIRPALCYIGRSQYAADPLLKGYLDDLRIYNYALTGEEVQNIITETTGIESVPASTQTHDRYLKLDFYGRDVYKKY